MLDKGSIRAVNLRIRDWIVSCENTGVLSRTESLAKAKLSAKFEEPCSDTSAARREAAWQKWIRTDEDLQLIGVLGPHWAKARLIVRDILSSFKMGELTFTNGSSYVPLGPNTSIAAKLTGEWTITHDCFDLFARYSFWHRAIKHAVKKRFKCYCTNKGYDSRYINNMLWAKFRKYPDFRFQIYCFKLSCVVTFVQGNRWTTVPKNNLKDRSICLEPSCNMLVQRAVGLGIRRCLKDRLGIDLDILADVHRNRISDPKVATIDLSDCSDTISMRLISYLLPKRVLSKVLASRSDMTLGPDDNFHVINKVSSMGNGFTFDLMSLVLTALTRSFDDSSTVFGDDIICQNQYAFDIVDALRLAKFNVNVDKTYIESDYRESCGSHYIDNYGYVTVFDLRWLRTPHDLVVACNKLSILAYIYGGAFETLRAVIWQCVPKPMLGVAVPRLTVDVGRPPSYDLSGFIRYGPLQQHDPPRRILRPLRRALRLLNKPGSISTAIGFVMKEAPAPKRLKSTQWDMFFQNIHSGRVLNRISRVAVKTTLVARVCEEQIGLTSTLLSQ